MEMPACAGMTNEGGTGAVARGILPQHKKRELPLSSSLFNALDGAKAPPLLLGHAQARLGATLALRGVFDFALTGSAQDDTGRERRSPTRH